jgi:hypothetical protein
MTQRLMPPWKYWIYNKFYYSLWHEQSGKHHLHKNLFRLLNLDKNLGSYMQGFTVLSNFMKQNRPWQLVLTTYIWDGATLWHKIRQSSPSRRREAPCEGTNSSRLFTPGETKALAESKVHQISRAWVTNDVEWVVILTDLKNMADCF